MSKYSSSSRGFPRWLNNTHASMMSLVLIVLVFLLSSSQVDPTLFEKGMGSFHDALGIPRIPYSGQSSAGRREAEGVEFHQEIIIVQLVEKLQRSLGPMLANKEAELIQSEQGVLLRLQSDKIFRAPGLDLQDTIQSPLLEMANLLKEVDHEVIVSGHTDNAPPPSNLPFTSNWGYSAAMAASVVQFLSETGGVPPMRLQARGMGQFSPIQTNESESGRTANRRIELMVSRHSSPAITENTSNPPVATQMTNTPPTEAPESDQKSQPSRDNPATTGSQGNLP
ncbi:MAG: OmpA family protein [Magnetococcales bacterium]|nr:OmpA family protein [Magnetococcales bacterium]